MKRIALLTAALVLLASTARAQEPRGIRTCDVSATPLAFGIFSGSRADSTSTITLTCNGTGNNNAITIALSQGVSNSFIHRFMLSVNSSGGSPGELDYNLYIDSGRSIIWGNGAGETQLKFGLFDFRQLGNVTQLFTIFGRVPTQNVPRPGHYADQIIITVVF